MKKSKVLALLLALVMLASLAACGGKTEQNAEKSTAEVTSTQSVEPASTVEAPKEPVTLRVLISDQPDYNNFPDNPIAKEIAKQTGVTINFEYADKDRFNVILAGGDLPDIVRALNKEDSHFKKLIEAESIIPLDDLLQTNGQNILTSMPQMIEFSKKYWSEGQNKVYFLSTNIGQESYGIEQGMGLVVRWDYYKELGYPEIKSMDDYLNVLKQMQEKHPKTADGKKIYGIGLWNDWGSWCYGMATSFLNRFVNYGTYDDQNTVLSQQIMPDGPQWGAVKWLHKANTMGLLDPDALIMSYNDLAAKATAGQLLYAPANWPFQDFNGQNAKNGQGYMVMPMDGGGIWAGTDWVAGWTDKGYSITKNCKTPDRAMDLLNYLWSYEGARLVYSGVQGEHWDIVDGKSAIKPEILQLKATGGDEFKKLQIAQNSTGLNYMVGFNAWFTNPNDNMPMSLFDTEDVYAASLNPLQKDFSDHYGAKYPSQAFAKKVQEGKMVDQKNVNMYVGGAMAQMPTDIAAISTKVDEAFIKAAAKAILAKSDAEYESVFNKFVEEANALGYPQLLEWITKTWSDAQIAVGAK